MTDSTRVPAPAATERRCPTCTTSFRPHPRKPSQIYCSQRCRAAAWRRRRALRPVTSFPATSNDEANEVRNDHDTKNADTKNADANEVNAVQRCPHCRQPIVLVTLITTPAAAHVAVPAPPATRITIGGYPAQAGGSTAAPTSEGP
jgi:endogenous inhibitor of DNA gyrase (YacG/DUF329 family)